MAEPLHKPVIPEQSRPLLEHIGRDRFTTISIAQRVCFPDLSCNAVGKLIRRLCRDGLLQKVPLQSRQQSFVLTPAAARLLGVSVKRTGPPGPQSLATEGALLHFVTGTSRSRRRLTCAELRSEFPWMADGLTRLPHCLDETDPECPILELVRVDLGGKADHVARKCERDVSRRRDLDGFQELLSAGRFRLAVITTTKPKFDAIRQALDRHLWPDGLAMHVVVLPQLLHFLGGSIHAT